MTWIGFGFTVPFGLSTEYDDNWEQAYEGTDAKIEVYDFNPTFAWKLSDKFSLGAGVSYQYVKAKLGFNKSATSGGAISNTHTRLTGDAWGWNIGAMWTPVENVRIGASYRSAVGHTVNGDLNVTVNKPVNDQVTTPATVSMDAPPGPCSPPPGTSTTG